MKKKMIVLIAFIYIASMLFCGDGVGKKFVEEKFPHLTYSDKACDDSKKKELSIVEDENTAGGILSYEELAAMENENASVRNNMLPDTDQLAFVDEAEKKGELAELKEQQNVKMPQVDMSFDNLVKNYYQVDKTTYIGADELCEEVLLGRDMSIEKSGNGPDILIYHTHSQEGYSDSLDTSETETVVGVGDGLESLLREKYGYNVLHHKLHHFYHTVPHNVLRSAIAIAILRLSFCDSSMITRSTCFHKKKLQRRWNSARLRLRCSISFGTLFYCSIKRSISSRSADTRTRLKSSFSENPTSTISSKIFFNA